MGPRPRFVAALALAAVLAAGAAQAQTTPPPAASLPDAGALPQAPVNARLPGVDTRECGTAKWSALCAAGRWSQYSTIDLETKTPGFTAHYTLEQVGNGDLHATYREESRAGRRGGEALLIGAEGIAYRTRDTLPPPDTIVDYMLSAPLMMSQLAAVLLDQGALVAPAEITKPETIKAASATQYIRTAAPRLAALYGPPWTMTGTVRPADDGRLAFTLRLRFKPVDAKGVVVAGRTEVVELTGTVSYAAKRGALPPTFDLVGWKLMKGDAPLPGVATLDAARSSLGL